MNQISTYEDHKVLQNNLLLFLAEKKGVLSPFSSNDLRCEVVLTLSKILFIDLFCFTNYFFLYIIFELKYFLWVVGSFDLPLIVSSKRL